MPELRRIASISEGVTLRWQGVSSFEIAHAGRVLLLDPFLSRPPEARPAAPDTSRRPDHADAILVSHGHHDHFGDVPALARRLGATVYVPDDVHRAMGIYLRLAGRSAELPRWRAWSQHRRVELAGLILEAHDLHREEREGRWLQRAAAAALRGRLSLRSLETALRLALTFPLADALGLQITHAATGASLFFLGSLTRQIRPRPGVTPAADILLLPAAAASDWWLDDAIGLVSLLRPRVVVVHHHDDWYPPLTRAADVGAMRRVLEDRCSVPVFEPPLGEPFTLEDLLAVAKRSSQRPPPGADRGGSAARRRSPGLTAGPGPVSPAGRKGRAACRAWR